MLGTRSTWRSVTIGRKCPCICGPGRTGIVRGAENDLVTGGPGGGGRRRGGGAGPREALVSSREDRLVGHRRKRAEPGILSNIHGDAIACTSVRNVLALSWDVLGARDTSH
jgi:hypothetical protein